MNLLPPHGERRVWVRRTTIALPLLCLLIFGTVIGARLISNASSASAANLAQISGYVPAPVKTSSLVGATDPNQAITLSVGLKLRNADNLKTYVDNATRADSVTRQHLTPSEIATAYAPLASSQQSVIDYLQSYGFTVTETQSQHLVVGVQGTVGDAENAFHLQINNYSSAKGQNFYAPSGDPSVPANLAPLIQNIAGLDNLTHFTHPPLKQVPNTAANSMISNVTCFPAQQGANYYIPSQIAGAYNLNGFYNNGFHGEGQTVGLVEFDDYSASDISNYTSCYGGGSVPISKKLVDGGPGAPGAGAIEDELDIEMILSAAPKLAGLDVFEAPGNSVGSNDMWAQIIAADSVPVVSTSWSECEADMSSADLNEENSLFTLAAAQGQTIFAASGDTGNQAACDVNNSVSYTFGVSDPSSQPDVTAVGGTTLAVSFPSTYSSEVVWNDSSRAASGGGISTLWPMPSWQTGAPGISNSYPASCTDPTTGNSSTSCREVPDVSLNATPNTGYIIYCSVGSTCSGGSWGVVGGTSAAAPLWAAFMALTNEKLLHDGGFIAGFINPYLYQIDASASGTSYSNDFHDITGGNNNTNGDGQGRYPATANYDMATGLGSYNAWNLGNDLEKLAIARMGDRQAPANTTWYFAEGSVGGSFQEFLTVLNPSSQSATVNFQYLFQGGNPITVQHVIAANSRSTVSANTDVGIPSTGGHQSISTIVTSTAVPIVVERPLYFNSGGVASGTDVAGATSSTNTTFYFAAGNSTQSSTQQFSEFVTILNPSSQTANITANFYSAGQVVDTESLSVPALQRGTITPRTYHGQAAIQVTSTNGVGVVVERPIYSINSTIPDLSGRVSGAASTVGATTPSKDWLFAEGSTRTNYHEDLVLANFDAANTANVTVNLEYSSGTVQPVTLTVTPQSQSFVNVNSFKNSQGATGDVSIEVTSDQPIVAERVMYVFIAGSSGPSYMGMTDVVGEAGPSSHSTYSFAEGYTAGSYVEFLTLLNPNANAEVVALTLFADNTIIQQGITLPAHSRTTISVNNIINPLAAAYPGPGAQNVSMVVQAMGGTVVAERPEYFNVSGIDGETDIFGYTGG